MISNSIFLQNQNIRKRFSSKEHFLHDNMANALQKDVLVTRPHRSNEISNLQFVFVARGPKSKVTRTVAPRLVQNVDAADDEDFGCHRAKSWPKEKMPSGSISQRIEIQTSAKRLYLHLGPLATKTM
jgi:hypothetical protein